MLKFVSVCKFTNVGHMGNGKSYGKRGMMNVANNVVLSKSRECFDVFTPHIGPKKVNFPIMITAEHASLNIPKDYDWPKEDKWLLGTHWSYDAGSAEFAVELCGEIGAHAAVLHKVSRLLLDPNRPLKSPTMFRQTAEGRVIHMNRELSAIEMQNRISRFYTPYHSELQYLGKVVNPKLILSIHSFTPTYDGVKRQVEVGVLYNSQEKAAKALCNFLESECGHIAKLNEPWSGKEGFMFAADSLQHTNDNKAIMLEFRRDLITNKEWRRNMIHNLVKFFGQRSDLFS